jgi:hypothetical protein
MKGSTEGSGTKELEANAFDGRKGMKSPVLNSDEQK